MVDIKLKRKYRLGGMWGFPAKPRTGNSHGPEKKRRKNNKAPAQGPPPILVVDGLTGKARFDRG